MEKNDWLLGDEYNWILRKSAYENILKRTEHDRDTIMHMLDALIQNRKNLHSPQIGTINYGSIPLHQSEKLIVMLARTPTYVY